MPITNTTLTAGMNDARGANSVFDARDFRAAMGLFATGVVVITSERDGHAHAMTANAFMSGSLVPPLVVVSVGHRTRMHEQLSQAQVFGVSLLAQAQEPCSDHFAGRAGSQFEPSFERLNGHPVLAGALVAVMASIEHAYPCGDHTLYVGRVHAISASSVAAPLLFFGGRYRRLDTATSAQGAFDSDLWEGVDIGW